jgi:hypothetical protein
MFKIQNSTSLVFKFPSHTFYLGMHLEHTELDAIRGESEACDQDVHGVLRVEQTELSTKKCADCVCSTELR